MADDVNQQIDDALNKIVKLTDQSGNLKKELKREIHETVSSLRNLIFTLKENLNERTSEKSQLQNEVNELKKDLEAHKQTHTVGQVAPSIGSPLELTGRGNVVSTPPSEGRKELYADVLKGKNVRRYKITVKSRDNQPADAVKEIIKSCIDPVDMKIGIRTFKGLKDGKVLIEADTKDDIEILNTQIRDKCGDRLEANVQKRRNPRIIVYNIPEEVTLENAVEIICAQNELALNKGDITPKFIFETKRKARNLVIELAPQTHRIMLQNKLKIGWMICSTADYIPVNRCFKCSRFNHHFSDCRSEETCPLCAGRHKLQECTASRTEYKCINCMMYNKHNQNKTINENHSSLDRKCPSMQAMITKYKQNTDY